METLQHQNDHWKYSTCRGESDSKQYESCFGQKSVFLRLCVTSKVLKQLRQYVVTSCSWRQKWGRHLKCVMGVGITLWNASKHWTFNEVIQWRRALDGGAWKVKAMFFISWHNEKVLKWSRHAIRFWQLPRNTMLLIGGSNSHPKVLWHTWPQCAMTGWKSLVCREVSFFCLLYVPLCHILFWSNGC